MLEMEATSEVKPSIEQSWQRELHAGHRTDPLWIQESIWMKCRKSQKAQPHLQLYRNSLALESTRVGDVSNHDMELSRSTNVIVAAGAKSRQVWKTLQLKKAWQPVPLLDHSARLLLPLVRLTKTSSSTSKALQCVVVLKICFSSLSCLGCQSYDVITSLSGWLKGSSHLVPLASSPPPTPPLGKIRL